MLPIDSLHRLVHLPRVQKTLAVFPVLVAVTLLAACGGAEESADTPVAAQPTTAAVQEPSIPEGTGDSEGISLYAGTGGAGFEGDGGPATEAEIYGPTGMALDDEGNLYISTANRIRRVDAQTGVVTTVAGTGSPGYGGDGEAAVDAVFKVPEGIAMGMSGNLYIADRDNGRIRMLDLASGVVTTIAGGGIPKRVGGVLDPGDGGLATDAWFREPHDVDVDDAGNIYFLADQRARMIDAATGIISTLAGTGLKGHKGDGGPGTEAHLADPNGVAVDPAGEFVYVADTANHRVRRIEVATGVITTIAGQGTVALGRNIDDRFFGSVGSREGGGAAGFEGDGGPAVDALLAQPKGVDIGPDGNLYMILS